MSHNTRTVKNAKSNPAGNKNIKTNKLLISRNVRMFTKNDLRYLILQQVSAKGNGALVTTMSSPTTTKQ